MTSITISSAQTLPKICASTGTQDATVKVSEDVTYGPKWIYWFIFVPMGFWITIVLQQLTQKRMSITYYLSTVAHNQLLRYRRTKNILIVSALLSFFLPIFFKQPLSLVLALVLFPIAFWYEQKFMWPFVVQSYTASTLTLGRLPSALVVAHEAAIASRRPKFPVLRGF